MMMGLSNAARGEQAGQPEIAPLVPTPRPRPANKDAGLTPHAAKPWLTLPPTPNLPTPARSDVIRVNGVDIYYATFGKGPAVLLLHGGLAHSGYWGHQIGALAEQFTVIVMDTRGHGRSPMTSAKFGYDIFANDAAELLAVLEIPFVRIVGWSDGAITGLQLAMSRPNLVSKLFAFGANSSVAGLKPGGSKTPVFASFAARCRTEYAQLSPRPQQWPQLASGLGAMWRTQPNYTPRQLAALKTTTAISDGEYDEIIKPEHTRQMSRQIPHSELLIQPAVSHFGMLQNAEQFNRTLLRFLVAED